MSTTLQELLNANNPISALTTELNSLANNGVALSGTVVSNKQGDSAGLGYPYCRAKLALGSAAFGTSAAVFGWWMSADDGTNYETSLQTSGTTTTPPVARNPDFVWGIDNVTQASLRVVEGRVPNCANNKLLLWNRTGVALAASGNSLNIYFYTDQLN